MTPVVQVTQGMALVDPSQQLLHEPEVVVPSVAAADASPSGPTVVASQGDPSGTTVTRGLLPKETIKRVVDQHRPEVRRCYVEELKSSPDLEGKVLVTFTIVATGDVSYASVKESTLHNERVESCVANAVRTWKFPEPLGGGTVMVTYPFLFKLHEDAPTAPTDRY